MLICIVSIKFVTVVVVVVVYLFVFCDTCIHYTCTELFCKTPKSVFWVELENLIYWVMYSWWSNKWSETNGRLGYCWTFLLHTRNFHAEKRRPETSGQILNASPAAEKTDVMDLTASDCRIDFAPNSVTYIDMFRSEYVPQLFFEQKCFVFWLRDWKKSQSISWKRRLTAGSLDSQARNG